MDGVNKPRRPWIAGLLSLITIGNGHVYAGRARRGLLLYILPQGLIVALSITLLLWVPAPAGLVLAALLFFGFALFCIVDAMRIARQNRAFYTPKRYNRWYVYLLFWAAANLVVQPLLGTAIKTNILQTYKIPSGAMRPAILVGDYVIAKKHMLMGPTVKRGEIVIFPYPKDPAKDFIKRVVGLGGERLEIKNKQVFIDGRPLEEPYAIHSDNRIYPADENPRDNFGPMLILPGYLFVMGDNRDESNDSRFWGFVPAESVSARAHRIYWSWDKETFRVRWNRIGNEIN
jgi:signal peptidase I